MGVDLRHHICQQLRLPALEDDDGRDAVHGAPDFRQAQQARLAVLVQLRSLIRRRAGLADGIGQLGEQIGALTLQGIVKKHHGVQFSIGFHGHSSSFFSSWGLVVIMRYSSVFFGKWSTKGRIVEP